MAWHGSTASVGIACNFVLNQIEHSGVQSTSALLMQCLQTYRRTCVHTCRLYYAKLPTACSSVTAAASFCPFDNLLRCKKCGGLVLVCD